MQEKKKGWYRFRGSGQLGHFGSVTLNPLSLPCYQVDIMLETNPTPV